MSRAFWFVHPMSIDSAILIAPDWPGSISGYQIAIKSSLSFFLRKYQDITCLILIDREPPDDLHQFGDKATFIHVPIRKKSVKSRFVKSLFHRAPASCLAFLEPHVVSTVADHVQKLLAENSSRDLILEDIPVCGLFMETPILDGLKHQKILRSHNVLSEAFRGFTNEPNPVKRFAWTIELNKILRFEKSALGSVDQVLAITNNDRDQYNELFPSIQIQMLPVGFDERFFDSTLVDNSKIDAQKILSLGTMDLRKSHGMAWFINSCFKKMPHKDPNLELILGGKGTDNLNNPQIGIQGLGFVDDEREFMSLGQLFVNPQKYGSGVKLKSLVAMAYGKCLISTSKGVEGIGAEPDTHFLLADTDDEMIDLLMRIQSGELDTLTLGRNARQFVIDHYSQSNIQIS